MKDIILNKIKERNYSVGIVGLGYVGLPLALAFHDEKFPVVGFDIDENKIEKLNRGESYIRHINGDKIKNLSESDLTAFTSDFSKLQDVDAIIMCVPTPLDDHREPDMSYVEGTTRSIAPHIRKGHLITLESTTYPGTTDELIRPICEEASGLKSGKDFYLAYSPEREDPGNPDFTTGTIPKVVGGDGADALEIANTLYGEVVVKTVPVSSTKAAEATKLLENIFRSVNIALVNELKTVFESMDIDIHEVIDAAASKPFGYMKFTPGPGLGGHCIPIDPFYLTWKAREYEMNTRFIELAGEINTNMPKYVIGRTTEALNAHKKSVNGSKVLVLGLSYKPDVDDMRESPTYKLMDLLEKYGADVSYYDPYIPIVPPTREHANWKGTKSIEWDKKTLSSFDAVVISTNHSCIDYQQLADWNECVVDTRNAMKGIKVKSDIHVWKA
ncbi:MAG TPA: nucleotide sugar dehydrogenase [Balneolaceae bacterium]|nr:nucleotide sugar dehydrogenase [Balneolaceae bacterium]